MHPLNDLLMAKVDKVASESREILPPAPHETRNSPEDSNELQATPQFELLIRGSEVRLVHKKPAPPA
jgi:hypothetical protein